MNHPEGFAEGSTLTPALLITNIGCIVRRNWKPSSSWKGRRIRGSIHITGARTVFSKICVPASCSLSTGYGVRSTPQIIKHGIWFFGNYTVGWLRIVMTAVFGGKRVKILFTYWTSEMLVTFIHFLSITIHQAARETWRNGRWPNVGGHIVSWESLWVTIGPWHDSGKQSGVLILEKSMTCQYLPYPGWLNHRNMGNTGRSYIFLEWCTSTL